MTKGTDIDTEHESGRLSLIAALGKGRELGFEGKLLWHLPDDMKRFKELTLGHPVIMGRKTWESLPEKFRPLPGRTNIVVTRQAGYEAAGAVVTNSLESARAVSKRAVGADEIFIIGGGELYAAALPFTNRLYLTLVDAAPEADTFFPPYEQEFKIIRDEAGIGEPPHRFQIFERK
ncbi:MAG: dihydrofolate reductase [Candidatus Paceibacterota bacterium]|jgi:dihydrofolate reductase